MNHLWWYLARSSGLTAWALVMSSIVVGISVSGRLPSESRTRRHLVGLHPWVSGTALFVVVLHVLSIVADSYVDISPAQALVPFASPYRTAAVAWGAIALWILLAVQLTSLARRWLTRRAWHGIHLLSYALAVLMTVHAFMAGTDTAIPLVAVAMASTLFVTTLLTVERIVNRRGRPAVASCTTSTSTPHRSLVDS